MKKALLARCCRRTLMLAGAAFALFLASCSTSKIEGLPSNLPDIPLTGTSATPPHNMASNEYPFDSGGRYVSEWAAEGERKAGRPASATNDDENKWSKSHGGRASSATKSKPQTAASSAGKTATKKTARYTVKSGDTLYTIAEKFDSTADKIKKANGLSSNKVRAGTVLTIPK